MRAGAGSQSSSGLAVRSCSKSTLLRSRCSSRTIAESARSRCPGSSISLIDSQAPRGRRSPLASSNGGMSHR
eukprot:8369903-Lingulodinium_polyedra.AAC.1